MAKGKRDKRRKASGEAADSKACKKSKTNLESLADENSENFELPETVMASSEDPTDLEVEICAQVREALQDQELIATLANAVANVVCKKIEKRLTAIEATVPKNLAERLGKLEDDVKSRDTEIVNLTKSMTDLQFQNDNMQQQLEESAQYSRRNGVRIFGCPEKTSEDTDKIVVSIAEKMGANISLSEISRSHRIGPPPSMNNSRPRPIIAKFIGYRHKKEFITKRSQLKDLPSSEPRIFVNDDMTKLRASLAARARDIKKSGKIEDTWCRDGIIFIKKSSHSGNKIIKITTASQMNGFEQSIGVV
jgi:hypothetical protein